VKAVKVTAQRKEYTPEEAPHGFREVYCTKCGYAVEVPVSCHDKSCVPCQKRRGSRTFFRVNKAVQEIKVPQGYRWRHLVLARQTQGFIPEGITRLSRAFREMRKLKWWDKRVKGGFYTIEVKRSKGQKGWHIHLHIVILCKELSTGVLRIEWAKIQGVRKAYAHIKDINITDKQKNMISYIVTYLIKKAEVTPELLEEFNAGMKNRHLISPFGCMYGQLTKQTKSKVSMVCPICENDDWTDEITMVKKSRQARRVRGPTEEDSLSWTPEIYDRL